VWAPGITGGNAGNFFWTVIGTASVSPPPVASAALVSDNRIYRVSKVDGCASGLGAFDFSIPDPSRCTRASAKCGRRALTDFSCHRDTSTASRHTNGILRRAISADLLRVMETKANRVQSKRDDTRLPLHPNTHVAHAFSGTRALLWI
jgi:hypothetical protein